MKAVIYDNKLRFKIENVLDWFELLCLGWEAAGSVGTKLRREGQNREEAENRNKMPVDLQRPLRDDSPTYYKLITRRKNSGFLNNRVNFYDYLKKKNKWYYQNYDFLYTYLKD